MASYSSRDLTSPSPAASAPSSGGLHSAISDASLGSFQMDADGGGLLGLGLDDMDEVDYRRRCHLLEASLVRFKEKATRVRELFTTKMRDMETQIVDANRRTVQAEEKCKNLEARYTAGANGSGVQPPAGGAMTNGIVSCSDDVYINQLRSQLQEQRDLRALESKLVAEKSAKIRDWVSKKVQEMESQSRQLADENTSLRDQLDRLRAELERCQRDFQSTKKSDSRSCVENSQPIDVWNYRQPSHYEDDYEEIARNGLSDKSLNLSNNNSDSGRGRLVAPPQCAPRIRIERKVFANVSDQPSLSAASSTTTSGSHEMLENLSGSTQIMSRSEPFPSGKVDPFFGGSARNAAHAADSLDPQTPVELTPKEAPSPLTPFLPGVPPNSPHPDGSGGMHADAAVMPMTLPRCKKDSQRFFAPDDHNGITGGYGPTMTIDRKYKTQPRPAPPAPPARRLPSWEGRIYAMVNGGLQLSLDPPVELAGCPAASLASDGTLPGTQRQTSDSLSRDLKTSIPVFSVLKGWASQIRSSPFTGDSCSESSDIEDVIAARPSRDRTSSTAVAKKNGGPAYKFESDAGKDAGKQPPSRDGSYSSLASETSSDYALPPEDGVSVKTDSSEVERMVERTVRKSVPVNGFEMTAKKDASRGGTSGYLLKMRSRHKVWRRWWFVMTDRELQYFRSPRGLSGKCCGRIVLDGATHVSRTPGSLQLFEIRTSKRIYHIACESSDVTDRWLKALRQCLRSMSTEGATQLSCLRTKDTISGWAVKVKNGRRQQCWCSLAGKSLIYYHSREDQNPIGQLSLRNARIEEVERSSDTDNSDYESDDITVTSRCTTRAKYTVAISPPSDSPTYLLLSSKQSKDSWLYHLVVASGGGGIDVKTTTDLEQLIARLMSVDGDSTSPFWYDPVLLHTKELSLPRPLSSVRSDELQRKALEIFKSVRTFTWLPVDSSSGGGAGAQADRHVQQAQSLLSTVLQVPELQTEFYCQLIKQTSRHPPHAKATASVQHFLLCGSHSWFQCDSNATSPTTNSSTDLPESKLNPANYVFVQGWQLLTMAVSLFVPRHTVLWLLKMHLQRSADSRTESGKYAIFCQCALERTLRNGPREHRPSRMEVLSILLHNPYYHSQPISIPVHFMNGSYQVISFDGSTTVQEFLLSLEKSVGVRDSTLSGFSLFADDPVHSGLVNVLPPSVKLCDVIAKWEQDYAQSSGSRFDVTRTIRLLYKNRLYFSKSVRSETEKERLLLVYQTNGEIVAGRFPVSRDLAIELAALMAQMEYGDLKSAAESTSSNLLLKQALDGFFPARYRSRKADILRELEDRLSTSWMMLRGKGSVDCVRVYLTVARKWTYFGAKLFAAKWKQSNSKVEDVWLAVHEDGVAILDSQKMTTCSLHSYTCIVTFGGYRDDFVLVVDSNNRRRGDGSERLLFALSRSKIAELTELIATYINARSRQFSDSVASRGSRQNTPLRGCSGGTIPSVVSGTGTGTLPSKRGTDFECR